VLEDRIASALQSLSNVFSSIGIQDIIDILLLAIVIYFAIKLVRETRAGQLVKGILLLWAVQLISSAAKLKALTFLSDKALKAGAIAVVILFQPEIRRILERFGQTTTHFYRLLGEHEDVFARWEKAIPEIVDAAANLSATRTGALMVIERATKLGDLIDNEKAVVMKAEVTARLLGNIFYPKTPLHDGAIIVRDGLIWAAQCWLPTPQKNELIDKDLGTRHRAAIGMSENSDAMIVVVSEETGQISVAHNGSIRRDLKTDELKSILRDAVLPPKEEAWYQRIMSLPFFRSRLHKQDDPEQDSASQKVQDPVPQPEQHLDPQQKEKED